MRLFRCLVCPEQIIHVVTCCMQVFFHICISRLRTTTSSVRMRRLDAPCPQHITHHSRHLLLGGLLPHISRRFLRLPGLHLLHPAPRLSIVFHGVRKHPARGRGEAVRRKTSSFLVHYLEQRRCTIRQNESRTGWRRLLLLQKKTCTSIVIQQ